MFNNFCINILLLISVTFIAGHVSKDRPFTHKSGIVNKIVLGIGGGVLGIGLMFYTIIVEGTTTIIDLRVMPVMMTYFIGGFIPSIITSSIILLFRIIYYGMSHSAFVGIIQIGVLIPIYYFIEKFNLNNKRKWVIMVLATMIVLIITVYYLLYKINNFFIVASTYLLFYIIAFILMYYLMQYVQSSNQLYRRYKGEATKDFLTELNNTRQFDLKYNEILSEAINNKQKLSLFIIDIDHFKNVNDVYGHISGDEVLKELGQILLKSFRNIDFVSRIGGEEFAVVLVNLSKVETLEIAERIRKSVEFHFFRLSSGVSLKITISVGIAIYPDTVHNADELKEVADSKLYKAKHTGRNKVCI